MLNPLVALTMSQAQMIDAIKDLANFGFDEFRNGHGVIVDMTNELPAYVLELLMPLLSSLGLEWMGPLSMM